jgi:hypothetical protein
MAYNGVMESFIRNVADLSANERHVYENLFGQPLQNHQQILVQLVNADQGKVALQGNCGANVLEPYAIWAESSDDEIAELESAILDRSESRPT